MSYILDALQRADAERARGSVPGLHTPQLAQPAARARRGPKRALWAGVVALLLLGSVALWRWAAPADEALAAAAKPTLAPLPPTPTPTPTPQAVPAPAAMPLAAPAPNAVAARPALAVPALPQVLPSPAAPLATEKAPPTSPVAPLLTEERRRQMPALNITGAVYSEVVAQRMLLVNGLVLKQGDSAAPELMLEEIGASASVFSYRGERFRVAH